MTRARSFCRAPRPLASLDEWTCHPRKQGRHPVALWVHLLHHRLQLIRDRHVRLWRMLPHPLYCSPRQHLPPKFAAPPLEEVEPAQVQVVPVRMVVGVVAVYLAYLALIMLVVLQPHFPSAAAPQCLPPPWPPPTLRVTPKMPSWRLVFLWWANWGTRRRCARTLTRAARSYVHPRTPKRPVLSAMRQPFRM